MRGVSPAASPAASFLLPCLAPLSWLWSSSQRCTAVAALSTSASCAEPEPAAAGSLPNLPRAMSALLASSTDQSCMDACITQSLPTKAILTGQNACCCHRLATRVHCLLQLLQGWAGEKPPIRQAHAATKRKQTDDRRSHLTVMAAAAALSITIQIMWLVRHAGLCISACPAAGGRCALRAGRAAPRFPAAGAQQLRGEAVGVARVVHQRVPDQRQVAPQLVPPP